MKRETNIYEIVGALTIAMFFMWIATLISSKTQNYFRVSCERKALNEYFETWAKECKDKNYISDVCALGSEKYNNHTFAYWGEELKNKIEKCK